MYLLLLMLFLVQSSPKELLLPDQDVLNAVYGSRILEIEDSIWNYDARNYNNYLLVDKIKIPLVGVYSKNSVYSRVSE